MIAFTAFTPTRVSAPRTYKITGEPSRTARRSSRGSGWEDGVEGVGLELPLAHLLPHDLTERLKHERAALTEPSPSTYRREQPVDQTERRFRRSPLARRIKQLRSEAASHEANITALVHDWRPDLLELLGVGPIIAGTALVVWSHPGRIRSEAAFAMLAGVAPIPASSGLTTRYRLNRRGDRHLNSALHIVAIQRQRHDPRTQAYFERRRAEGKTDREIRRCLKRYIARELYRTLENGLDNQ